MAAWPLGAAAEGDVATWFKQDRATGDWGGARTSLNKAGVTPEGNYTTDLLANPVGGLTQGGAYAAVLYGSLEFDLEKLAGLNGLTLFAAGSWSDGRNLSATDIGNFFTVSEIFTGNDVRLSALYLEQSLWQDEVNVAVGRLTVGETFVASTLYDYYVSGAINGNPSSLGANIPSFTEDPFAQWGARAVVRPREDLYLSTGIYNADPSVQEDGSHGVDFVFNPDDGVLAFAQAGFHFKHGLAGDGRPGHLAVGGYYDSSDFARLDDPGRQISGNYGFYVLAEHMVYQEAGGDGTQGLTPWAVLTFAPMDSINTLPFAAFGGMIYRGLIPERDDDVTAFGLYYGAFSEELPDRSYELVFELNHRLQIAPWFYVTPQVQYILNPGGSGDISDALVLGAEIAIDF